MVFTLIGCSDEAIDSDSDIPADTDDTDDTDLPIDTSPPIEETVTVISTKDAMVRLFGSSGDGRNYGSDEYNSVTAWTNGGTLVLHRSFIEFDLTSIPSTANISQATLKLYADANSTTYPDGHDRTGGANACQLTQVSDEWQDSTITWDIQPLTDSATMLVIPETSDPFENKEVDVTEMVEDMVASPEDNHGFRLMLANENYYLRVVFASSDHPDDTLHPALVVTYSE